MKMPLFGGARQKITGNTMSDLSLSPDGRQFAFASINAETDEHALIVANTDGTSEYVLTVSPKGIWFGT